MSRSLDIMTAALPPESVRRARGVTAVVAPVLIVVNHLPCVLGSGSGRAACFRRRRPRPFPSAFRPIRRRAPP